MMARGARWPRAAARSSGRPARRTLPGPCHLGGGLHRVDGEDSGRWLTTRGLRFLIQAAQYQGPLDAAVDYHRPDSALAHYQARLGQMLYRPAYGRAAHAETLAQQQPFFRQDLAVLDGESEVLGDLEVQRHRARLVDLTAERGLRPRSSVAPLVLTGIVSNARSRMSSRSVRCNAVRFTPSVLS
jgi:hypothetical protein